ncbi:MAG TPA: OPT/YSL family transporter, partial [Thermoanaerobaculia bacterium]|nr:OPT/YSL family transporter [Thermoanaerobaculia bacterium]
ELPAPQATLMKTVIDGVLAGSLPWGLVGTGSALAVSAILAGLPGLAFAVGIYLPVASLTPIFLGGVVRRIVEARQAATGSGKAAEGDAGVLAASGMIAGEGLAGVAIAFLVAAQTRWPEAGWSRLLEGWHFADGDYAHLAGPVAAGLGVALVLGIGALLYRAGMESTEPKPAPE